MDDFLLRLTLDVKTISPLHIGTGEKLSGKSFVLSGGRVIVADERKLIAWAGSTPQSASAFTAFAERANESLSSFFQQQGLAAQDFAAYQAVYAAADRPRDVLVFIKSSNARPYLPGSSLKGSVRSALLRGVVIDRPALAGRLRERAEAWTAEGKRHPGEEIEALVFVPAKNVKRGQRSNYDLVRSIGFSDSSPVSADRLQVVEVRVLSAQTNQTLKFKQAPHSDNIMQIYAETIRPGTTFRLNATLNEALLDGRGAASRLDFKRLSALIRNFARFCRTAAANLIEQEIQFYQSHNQGELAQWYTERKAELEALPPDSAFLLPIGWGTGYDAKTVTDQLGEEVFQSVVEQYRNTKRLGKPGGAGRWLGTALSPKSRKVVFHTDERLEPVGWVQVKILEG